MNEEIQKELLSILRAMKDGAPNAWRELVEQRAAYCMISGLSWLVINVLLMLVGATMAWRCRKGPFEADCTLTVNAGGVAAGAIMVIIATAALSCAVVPMLAEGMAPLGRVLEMLR